MGKARKKFITSPRFFALFLFLLLVSGGNLFVSAQTSNTNNANKKSLLARIPVLNKVEAFRLKNYNQCGQRSVQYGKLLDGKDFNKIIDATKRDLAYEATQKALPPDLRKTDEAQNYGGPKNFLNYHYSNLCAKFFGSTLFYYGALVLLLLIIIKSLFKK